MLGDKIENTEIFYVVITTAQTVGALGAGWREEKDECYLVWPPGCCGELDETLLRPTGIKGRTFRPKRRPLLASIVLASASYLIGNPMASICNSNENQTPVPSTLAPALHICAAATGGRRRRRKAAQRKVGKREGGVGDSFWRRIFHYWKIRW